MGEILRIVVGIRAPKKLSNDFSHPSDSHAYVLVIRGRDGAIEQDLHGEALVKALQKGGYILVRATLVHRVRCLTTRLRIPITASPKAY